MTPLICVGVWGYGSMRAFALPHSVTPILRYSHTHSFFANTTAPIIPTNNSTEAISNGST